MSKTKFYRQCVLQKGNSTQVSHIPVEYAIAGDVLKLRDDAGVWEDGWKVISAGPLQDAEIVEANEMLWKRTRKQSDI